ncbi:MAG TPA: cytochrome d ubiquinol oxidase subunit II, partial [Terriglobales bacterium]|nr:cytochrome d ubiquinol oxidase subunit II [Terriglobales bacterium]
HAHPVGLLIPLVVAGALGMILHGTVAQKERLAFAGSILYLAAMLVGAAFALYPNVLPASTDPAYSLTIYNTAAAHYGLTIGIIWWILGMILALGYFFFVYRLFRGKVKLEAEGEGY